MFDGRDFAEHGQTSESQELCRSVVAFLHGAPKAALRRVDERVSAKPDERRLRELGGESVGRQTRGERGSVALLYNDEIACECGVGGRRGAGAGLFFCHSEKRSVRRRASLRTQP